MGLLYSLERGNSLKIFNYNLLSQYSELYQYKINNILYQLNNNNKKIHNKATTSNSNNITIK
jgi:hypothetical protein